MPSGMNLRDDCQGANQRGRTSAAGNCQELTQPPPQPSWLWCCFFCLLFLLSLPQYAQFRQSLVSQSFPWNYVWPSDDVWPISLFFWRFPSQRRKPALLPFLPSCCLEGTCGIRSSGDHWGCHTWGMAAVSHCLSSVPHNEWPQSCSSCC